MAGALCVSASFVTGRYHGQEWPPSPARLVQALVAGVMTGGYRGLWSQVEPALRWLERQPAPEIQAVATRPLRQYRLAVPNNDMDAVAREWAAGRPANPAELRTMKLVQPHGMRGTEPHVRYMWRLQDEDDRTADQLLAALRPLTHCLHTLGWGIDMAYADAVLVESFTVQGGHECWKPSRSGEQLAVPAAGFIDDLGSTYLRFRERASAAGIDADTRPTAYRLQGYIREGDRSPRYAIFGLQKLERDAAFSYPWEMAAHVAGWMRHAAATALNGERLPEALIKTRIHGHTDVPSENSGRISFVPLPSIGHTHTDGRIRRVMLVEPAEADDRAMGLLRIKLRG